MIPQRSKMKRLPSVAAFVLFLSLSAALPAHGAAPVGPTHEQVLKCMQAVVASDGADQMMLSRVLVNGCAACQGWAMPESMEAFGSMLGERCSLFCSPEARNAFAAASAFGKWPAVARLCPVVPAPAAGLESLRSDQWLALDQVGRFA